MTLGKFWDLDNSKNLERPQADSLERPI